MGDIHVFTSQIILLCLRGKYYNLELQIMYERFAPKSFGRTVSNNIATSRKGETKSKSKQMNKERLE